MSDSCSCWTTATPSRSGRRGHLPRADNNVHRQFVGDTNVFRGTVTADVDVRAEDADHATMAVVSSTLT